MGKQGGKPKKPYGKLKETALTNQPIEFPKQKPKQNPIPLLSSKDIEIIPTNASSSSEKFSSAQPKKKIIPIPVNPPKISQKKKIPKPKNPPKIFQKKKKKKKKKKK